MALKLELKPGEKFVVNGAVITAGRSGASLVLHNKAVLLRGRDVMQEEEANTPARRLYFSIMLMYIDPADRDRYRKRFNGFWDDFMSATTVRPAQELLRKILETVEAQDYYRAMKLCRQLVDYESSVLSPMAEAGQ
ncbi:MAG: flagellar biosynthesis repressor FlbT [Alphaproteobacteria bacterium]|nr:flagellar biosynthesis repressor FlbT [Alphaproteobacteria bacterium]